MNRIDARARTPHRFREAGISFAAIKKSIAEENYENPTHVGLLYFFRDLIFFAACCAALIIVDEWYLLVPLWVLSGMLISGLFVIGHDAAHGSLFANKRLAHWIAQICFLPAMNPFSQWAYGHNRVHHGRTVEVHADPVWHPTTPARYRALSLPAKLLHRFYWSGFGAGFYYLVEIWLKKMLLDADHQKVRGALRDKIIVIGFGLGASAALLYHGGGGSPSVADATFDWSAAVWMWVKVFAIPYLIWNYLSGTVVYMQHIHPSIPWLERDDWTPEYGQLFATVNFHVPFFINFFIHNILIHVPHHIQIRIPFYYLPEALRRMDAVWGDLMHQSDRPVREYLRIVRRCKLFEPGSGWYTYSAAREAFGR